MTRRQFLIAAAVLGSSTTALAAARGLGLIGPEKFALAGQVEGMRVIILGAGLAGMTAAYELGKLGYDCRILEARSRAGGRCWTIRRGTTLTEIDGQSQTAAFERDLYFNPGPARIPHHHQATLDYCRELGVAIEPFVQANEAAYYYHEGNGPLHNRPLRIRQVKADLRGYTSELLAKAIGQEALAPALSAANRQQLRQFLAGEGDLGTDAVYHGSNRRGYSTWPGAGPQPGTVESPHDLSDLLQSELGHYLVHDLEIEYQTPMFQIVGGTDNLAAALAERVEARIEYQARVQEIRKAPDGVRVVYAAADGIKREIRGDYCICTIPLPVLKSIPADFSSTMKAAINSVEYAPAGKMGLQFSRRFWEEDEGIYGGITQTNMAITRIWYPSSGYLTAKGVLVGYYDVGPTALNTGAMTPTGREAWALDQGRKIHPQYDDTFETSFSVPWHKVEYNLGGWANYAPGRREQVYATLSQPDDRIYLAGEHISYLTGWMAGAFESARRVATLIHERSLAS